MKNMIIESAKVKNASAAYATAAAFAAPFYSAPSLAAVRADALFWSVFGPAARYNFRNQGYAYAALMKP